ncbi:hypothetical protein [Chryseosolibacter indicus]|uniref:Group-specific protein n=1 Tax=Chryseosolibacter indicus TaxID=2782351 RepID=A0ABS5VRV0_9BACT|nr:hypothetical protein [Chryseosolibacter indicus]MBT1704172.1 hypothetical protein [Chryseosolibacter indicus]
MILLRILVIAFNAVVISFLIYRMLEVFKQPVSGFKKTMVIIGGLVLLLVPFGIFLRFFAPTFQYFIIYPIAIAVYLYMIKEI